MKILVDNRHMDYSGGGEHVRMIVSLLSSIGDIYVTKNPDFYSNNDFASTKIVSKPKKYKFNFIPDVFLYIDYRNHIVPIGRVNAQVCFYGLEKIIQDYDYAICINKFVADTVDAKWQGVQSVIIPPFFDENLYTVSEKEKKLINIGNFFLEADGHSKNQHVLIEWFLKSGLIEKGWSFDFYGFKNDDQYFQNLEKKIQGVSSIKLNPDARRSDMLDTLSRSKFLVHGMGYGRIKPEQTEHFGLVAVEALLSGCRPIVHKSGGCPDIEGTLSYENLDQILPLIESESDNPLQIRQYGLNFNYDNSLIKAKQFLNAVEADFSKKGSQPHLLNYIRIMKYFFSKK